MVSVLIVEDEPHTRERLVAAVDADGGLMLSGSASSLAEGRAALAHAAPDVLLTDLGLPDGNGIDLIREMRVAHPDSQAMVVTVFADEDSVLGAIRAGATGYLLKDSLPEEIASGIHELVAGASPISPAIARHLLRSLQPSNAEEPRALSEPLTDREIEVLQLVAKGFSSPEIARLLERSPHTIKTHVRHIYRKLEVTSRGEAVLRAVQQGLIDER